MKREARLTVLAYKVAWPPYRALALRIRSEGLRDTFLGYYGSLSLLALLIVWAAGMILGFAMLHWGLGSHMTFGAGHRDFWSDLYLSGTSFFTLGLGDIAPTAVPERAATVIEAGIGLGFLALVIAYLPVLYQSFSRREVFVSRMDAEGGSPPTGGELLRRHLSRDPAELREMFKQWEHWAAELMDSTLSYPVLAYYRSQHDRQSWLCTLTAILDACAIALASPETEGRHPTEVAFAMGCHAAIDLCQVLHIKPYSEYPERLPDEQWEPFVSWLADGGIDAPAGTDGANNLSALRRRYEPYVNAMSDRLLFSLPPWVPAEILQPPQ